MKIRKLTQAQKKKVDKIDALLTQLRKEGVYPYCIAGARNPGLEFIRSNNEDRWNIGDAILEPSENEDLYDEITDKKYQTKGADFNNPIDILGI